MKIPLSSRLRACCNFVTAGDRVADIGCDHGYLGIHLLKSGIASSVIAADINQQPLDSAFHNAHKYGVADRISFYLSDGVRNVPRDFDAMVCAGMGADTMISILEAAPWLRCQQYRLILQCQSKTAELRRYLSDCGWHIANEVVLRDGRFLYTIMEVLWQPEMPRLTVGQWYFSPAMLKNPTDELHAYYASIVFRLRRAITGRGENADPKMTQALKELEAPQLQSSLGFVKEEHNDDS